MELIIKTKFGYVKNIEPYKKNQNNHAGNYMHGTAYTLHELCPIFTENPNEAYVCTKRSIAEKLNVVMCYFGDKKEKVKINIEEVNL